ncbi:MAG: tetratricopeptide repeat protein, partial [Bacteroidota bacterium]
MKKIMILLGAAILAAACVTQKSRSDISPVKKFYHDLNSEFNGYFNAGELYDAAVVALEEQHTENYNRILPIYPYSAALNPQAVAPDMDEAIKKVTVIRALHEPSHWIDDCYLMAGKAQFLKQDYESAEETLRFLVDELSPEARLKKGKNKKKSSVKPVTAAQKKAAQREREQLQKERAQERKEKLQTRAQERKQKEKERKAAKKQKEKEYKERKKARAQELKARKKARKKGEKAPSRRTTEVVDDTPKPTRAEQNAAKKAAEEVEKQAAEAAKAREAQEKRAAEIAKAEKARPFKHRPAHQEGQLWLARTLIERDKFDQAKYLMESLKRNKNLYKNVARELSTAEAHYFLQQKEYDKAISPLQEAKSIAETRAEKARFSYILAQIYQQKNQPAEAKNYFQEVIKFRPAYEMEFSARMSMTLSDYYNGTASAKSAIKAMNKMLKDEKNIDYKDRIYFAMSEIYLKDQQEELGIAFLKKALEEGGGNQAQKAEALVKLAYLFYQEEDYVKAVEYFTEALKLLPKTDDRYEDMKQLNATIGDVAANIELIALQDSLLRIGRMTNDEKRAMAYEIRQQELEEQRERIRELNNGTQASRGGRGGAEPGLASAANKSSFFAYDDRAVKRGKRSFERAWGESRSLEDNWRRSNRQSLIELEENDTSN